MPSSCTILCSGSHRFTKWERYTEELQFLWKKKTRRGSRYKRIFNLHVECNVYRNILY